MDPDKWAPAFGGREPAARSVDARRVRACSRKLTQLLFETVAMSDVHRLQFLEAGEKPFRFRGFAPVLLKGCDHFALHGQPILSTENALLGLGKMTFDHEPVHGSNNEGSRSPVPDGSAMVPCWRRSPWSVL